MVSKRSRRKIGHCGPLETHKTLILRKEDGDASINFADSERDEHVWLERELRWLAVHCGSMFVSNQGLL